MNADLSTKENSPIIVHCADLHLDSPFSNMASDSAKAVRLREEQLAVLGRIITLARKTGASFILIAGDLFESNKIKTDTLDQINKKFASVPEVSVCIVGGNHDPYTPESPLATYRWAPNVYVFGTELTCFQRGNVRIYGRSFSGCFSGKTLLRDKNGELPQLDKSYINILLLHGDISSGTSVYNPISPDEIAECGFDYAALGHIHKATEIEHAGKVPYSYCGAPQGRGFDEDGSKGVMLLQLGKGSFRSKFVSTCLRHYVTKKVDITGCDGNEEICAAIIDSCPLTNDIYKVELTGALPETFIIPTARLENMLAEKYFYLKIKDCTQVEANLELLQNEATVKGIFTKNMLEAVADEKLRGRALKFGLQAFEGDVVIDEDR